MRLYYDNIIFSLQKIGGISVYWKELLKRVLLENEIKLEILENPSSNLNIVRETISLEPSLINFTRTNFLSRVLPVNINSSEKFIFHSSYYRHTKSSNAKVITTVHDFVQEKINASYLNSLMKRRAINNSDVIIAISENTKSDLLNFYPLIDEKKVKVIYNGVSDSFFRITSDDQIQYENVLFVGSRASYKNFDFAVNLISKFSNLRLIIVGEELSSFEKTLICSKIPQNRWRIVVKPTDAELNILYNTSAVLLYPSSYEGFGIPIVEAMKATCPVIALNVSSIPEVAGEAAVLLDKLSIDDFYFGIKQILSNREKYVNLGIKNAKRFSWEKTYLETLNVYKNE
jgi:mannosyltransferase